MTAACSKGSGGIFRKITKNQLNQGGGGNGPGVGEATNHTHAAAAPSLTPSLKAQEKKGNIFTYFQLNRKWKSRCSCRGRERERKREGRERERACATIITLFLSTRRGERERHHRLFPTCQARRTASAPLSPLLQPQLLSLRAVCFVVVGARRAANDANGLNAARSISSSPRYASAPSVVQ